MKDIINNIKPIIGLIISILLITTLILLDSISNDANDYFKSTFVLAIVSIITSFMTAVKFFKLGDD